MIRILAFFLISLVCSNSYGQEKRALKDLDLDEILAETQFMSDSEDYMEMVWWIPTEYWEAVYANDTTITPDQAQEIVSLLEQNDLIAVVRGKIGMFGGVNFDDYETIRNSFDFTYESVKYQPMDPKDLNPDLSNFLSIIKPMLSNMMGNFGENLHILVYRKPGSNKAVIDPFSKKNITFGLGKFETNITLPLGSLLKRKICPEDNVLHTAKWNFCPFHGTALEEQ